MLLLREHTICPMGWDGADFNLPGFQLLRSTSIIWIILSVATDPAAGSTQ